ncbi:MAG: AraC family transcriptional regulator [Phenylobacterium zucineum]|nr:MAG: AraC family transcriptional regulator [Phenylobacterium zucineum]
MAEPTVGAGFARGLLEFAVSRGADRHALAAAAGVPVGDFERPDGRVAFAAYVRLMRAAKAATGDPALALHYAETIDISRVSIVGLISQAAPNMLDAFAALNHFVRLIVETENEDGGDRFRLVRDREGLWLADSRLNANAFPELTESAFAQLVCGPRRHGFDTELRAVHVTHPDPGYRDEYERIFRAPVVFASTRNAMLIRHQFGEDTLELIPGYAGGVLSGHAEHLLADLESSKSTRGRVEAVLRPVLEAGGTSMDAVASRLGLSRQTLYRKLKSEGVTFEQVLDGLRHRLALHLLSDGRASVNETAYRLGFSDPAAFSRAFKRWTGVSPSEASKVSAPG